VAGIVGGMTDVSRGRDRRHLHPGRPGRIAPRFTAQEMAELTAAAAVVGLTPTGFLAEAGLATARRIPSPELDAAREELARLQRELFALSTYAGRVRARFAEAGDGPAAAICRRLSEQAEAVIDRVDRHLRLLARDRRRRDSTWQAFPGLNPPADRGGGTDRPVAVSADPHDDRGAGW
jgi:hypothetical protein